MARVGRWFQTQSLIGEIIRILGSGENGLNAMGGVGKGGGTYDIENIGGVERGSTFFGPEFIRGGTQAKSRDISSEKKGKVFSI